ncbi:SRPBCC family protein [Leptospira sp. 201903071]|uniref:SRPBCC family protein n=1 Tax=Leptospira ainazelensis TaxID=2810034 RepID=UPI001966A14D|nr:SRPBCC family protein [Leptospira ainazelensis]MBM9499189.1 SRPBCC family protein [Leptospira ainazelensis]
MKILLYIAGGLVALVVVLALIAPKDFQIEREIVINKPNKQVFDQIKFLKNHEQWNAWSKKDPKMKKEFKGIDGTVGFTSSWESENPEVGTAEEEIVKIVDGEKLETQLRFKKPFEASFTSYITTKAVGENQTKVSLGMFDRMSFPMTVISFILNVCLDQQKEIIDNMDESLKNLKTNLEK